MDSAVEAKRTARVDATRQTEVIPSGVLVDPSMILIWVHPSLFRYCFIALGCYVEWLKMRNNSFDIRKSVPGLLAGNTGRSLLLGHLVVELNPAGQALVNSNFAMYGAISDTYTQRPSERWSS